MNRRYTAVGFTLVILLFASLTYMLLKTPFKATPFIHEEIVSAEEPSSEIGRAMSNFLWERRGFDLLMQTLVLFATAVCCLAMLRPLRR